MKLKSLFLCLCLLAGINASAYDAEIDGIYFNFITEDEAQVTKGSYSDVVVIPESITYNGRTYQVTSIDNSAFSGCTSMTSVIIPNSVTSIGREAFRNCTGLTSVTIGSGVTTINYRAFWGCTNLTKVILENNAIVSASRTSGLSVFGDQVKEYVIGNSVESIGDYVFSGSPNLTSVTIGNGVTSIGESAFWACDNLTSVTIGNGVTSIGWNAFLNCRSLTAVHISDLTAWCNISFCNYASHPLYYAHHLYMNGEEIKDLIIPDAVTSIGDHTFWGCSGLTSVTFPNSLKSLGEGSFDSCSSLTSVTLPESLTDIGIWTFYKCTGLTSVTIPESVTTIGEYTFYQCPSLTTITIPKSVTSIGEYAFSDCSSLTSVTIGSGVKNIGTYAFCFCKALREIYCYAEETPDIDNYTFVGVDASSVMLVVPEGAVKKYKVHPVWGQFFIETPTRLNPAFSEREEATFVYDLTGRRLSRAQRGVNIVGGKKIVVK